LASAVRARLDASGPIVAELSGGLDSSSIVWTAHELLARAGGDPGLDGRDRADMRVVSAAYPGLPCDESAVVRRTAEKLHLAVELREGTREDWADPASAPRACPWPSLFGGGRACSVDTALRDGARVILNGWGGNELAEESGLFAELAASRKWLDLA